MIFAKRLMTSKRSNFVSFRQEISLSPYKGGKSNQAVKA